MSIASPPPQASLGSPLAYIDIFHATPIDRIRMIKDGMRAVDAKRVVADLAIAQGPAFAALKLSAATVNRKAAQGKALSLDESERVLGVVRLIGQVQAMVEESGVPKGFNAARWIARWLEEPLPALGRRRPLDFLDTMEGQALVADLLAQAQSGAYA